MLGLIVFNFKLGLPGWSLFLLGALAFIGSGLVSYASARSQNLRIDLGKPTLASKATRTTVIAIAGILSGFFTYMPMTALCYLVLHPNVAAFANQELFSRWVGHLTPTARGVICNVRELKGAEFCSL